MLPLISITSEQLAAVTSHLAYLCECAGGNMSDGDLESAIKYAAFATFLSEALAEYVDSPNEETGATLVSTLLKIDTLLDDVDRSASYVSSID